MGPWCKKKEISNVRRSGRKSEHRMKITGTGKGRGIIAAIEVERI